MEIVNLTKETYKEWDDFCLVSDDAWFWHTSHWLEYTLRIEEHNRSESKSFFVRKDGVIIAICPLLLEEQNGVKEFSLNHYYGFMPAFANHLTQKEHAAVMKVTFGQIDFLAKENQIKKAMMRGAVLNPSFLETHEQSSNTLMKFGFLDTSLNTQVIEVRRPLEVLKKEMRHGHASDIQKASKLVQVEICDAGNITKEVSDAYRALHRKAAGRETRTAATFDMMHEWIKNGWAFLVGAKKDGVFISFSYFFIFKKGVYYGSSCNDRETGNVPASHLIQWKAIEWMHAHEVAFYEIGWQYFSLTLSDFPDDKHLNISKFMRGFGGFTVPVFLGEKYYDKEYFLSEQQGRIKKYAELNFKIS